ncbi:MAG: permease [Clostridiales bacterium]|jgi:uncharacterized membrane protein YraQ (UPF0718 family)|nr:permease [Clostridiales bacterium]
MALPIYVATGFLDSGKTTFLNNLLNRGDWHDVKMLVLQFESGDEEFHSRHENCQSASFSKKDLEQRPEQIVESIRRELEAGEFDEIWIEWNGVAPFSQLQALLLHPKLHSLATLKRVIHIADGKNLESLLGRTGGALPEQIANSDFAVVRNVHYPDDFKRVKRLLSGINPGIAVYEFNASNDLYKQIFAKRANPVSFFILTLILAVELYFVARPALEGFKIPFNTIVNVFLGILLQAVPFLLIGVLLSSFIQIFIPQRAIESRFPKSLGLGMLAAIIGGFCLPVCDCASIPIFRSLVRKGIPLPVAVTFMAAAPIINPVVILSTYYAFTGNMTVVVGRVALGIIVSVATGLAFALWPSKKPPLSGGALDRLMCGCGCYEDAESITSFSGKAGLFIRHSQAEFFSVGKYLVIGTFIASIFQVIGTGAFRSAQSGAGLAFSIIIMMVMAFALSLCSSSDAVIARSFSNQFPLAAIMGFLVFGPIMDIKNAMMLSSGFSKSFIAKLLLASFIASFAAVFLISAFGGF